MTTILEPNQIGIPLTPFHPKFGEVKAKLQALRKQLALQVPLPQGATSTDQAPQAPSDSDESQALDALEDELPYGEFLRPCTKAYERAIAIGNLLYRLKTPAAVTLPRNTKDMKDIIKCARDNDITLTIKNGGHSYAGYCLNQGGIVMDLSAMKGVEFSQDGTLVTIQAGCIWADVYDALAQWNPAKIIIGGQCPFVGVSGFTLGGGLSPFSRCYGMGIDNVTEMTVITAGGDIVTVNDHETDQVKKDLFWALRGGGGGNFGVLVEFKSKIHDLRDPTGDVVCGELTWYLPEQREDYMAMMNEFNSIDLPDELTIDAYVRYNKDGQLLGQMTVIFNGGQDAYKEAIKPLTKYNPSSGADDPKVMKWQDWVVLEEGYDVKSNIYHHHASFIFGKGAITSALIEKVTYLMFKASGLLKGQGSPHFLWDHMGGQTSVVKAEDTAFFWRDGVYAANFKVSWQDPQLTDEMFAFMEECKDLLTPHALNGAAGYLNYIDSTVENWQEAYYGSNYARLQDIKGQWDPNDLFFFDQGIRPKGKEGRLPRRLRVPVGIITTPKGNETLGWAKEPLEGSRGSEPVPPSERVLSQWKEYSLPNPDIIGKLGDDDLDRVFGAVGAERVKKLFSTL